MKTVLSLSALLVLPASAQWTTTAYSLKGGWTSIHLQGDAIYTDIEDLPGLPAEVEEIWQWLPNPSSTQFTDSPLLPTQRPSEWAVWRRGNTTQTTLLKLSGNRSYLVKCSGDATASFSFALKHKAGLVENEWVSSGANFFGFPSRAESSPSFSTYFQSFPQAISSQTRIYKYVGGPLGQQNPVRIFATNIESLDPKQSYWFSTQVVGGFEGPLDVAIDGARELAFQRSGRAMTLLLRNRGDSAIKATLTNVASESAPAGQPTVTGVVPLTERFFNTETASLDARSLNGLEVVVAPQSTKRVIISVDRTDASIANAADGTFFASILQIRDDAGLMDISIPASAYKGSLAGLWAGDAVVSTVANTGFFSGDTAAAFPLRFLMHVNDQGEAKILSQAYLGSIKDRPGLVGVSTVESRLEPSQLRFARRLVAAHLPLDRIEDTTGTVATGSAITATIKIPFNDPTNPFVHQYHPDHDNTSPRGEPPGSGTESYTITRSCTFTFATNPPAGSGVSTADWGSTTIGGSYSETTTGLSKDTITSTGTFLLHRLTEDAELFTN